MASKMVCQWWAPVRGNSRTLLGNGSDTYAALSSDSKSVGGRNRGEGGDGDGGLPVGSASSAARMVSCVGLGLSGTWMALGSDDCRWISQQIAYFSDFSKVCTYSPRHSSPSLGRSPDLRVNASGLPSSLPGLYSAYHGNYAIKPNQQTCRWFNCHLVATYSSFLWSVSTLIGCVAPIR